MLDSEPRSVPLEQPAEEFTSPSADDVMRDAFKNRYTHLVGLGMLVVGDRAAAEELVQEAFARTWEKWSKQGSTTDPSGYLWVTVLNLSRRRLRRRRVRERPLPTLALPDRSAADPAVHVSQRRDLINALVSLPQRQREVVVARFYLDLSVSEISDALGIGAPTVKTHLARATAALSEQLENRDER